MFIWLQPNTTQNLDYKRDYKRFSKAVHLFVGLPTMHVDVRPDLSLILLKL